MQHVSPCAVHFVQHVCTRECERIRKRIRKRKGERERERVCRLGVEGRIDVMCRRADKFGGEAGRDCMEREERKARERERGNERRAKKKNQKGDQRRIGCCGVLTSPHNQSLDNFGRWSLCNIVP